MLTSDWLTQQKVSSDWLLSTILISYWLTGGSALNEEEKKMIEEDFDFETNLAMFDKDREMREIEADLMSNKPDIVRLVHCNVRQPEPKYR